MWRGVVVRFGIDRKHINNNHKTETKPKQQHTQTQLVISQIPDSAPTSLLAVKLLAQHSGGRVTPEAAAAMLSEWLADPACSGNPHVRLAAGLIHAAQGNEVEALRALNGGGAQGGQGGAASLEAMALSVQVLLQMNRADKAEAVVRDMAAVDDDATVAQLAAAWAGVQLGGAKVQEAAYIYQELGDKFAWTPQLHAGLAACRMKMGEWEDAERDLKDALEKDPGNADALANMAAVALHLGRADAAAYLERLRAAAPGHPAARRAQAGEELFARAAAAVAS